VAWWARRQSDQRWWWSWSRVTRVCRLNWRRASAAVRVIISRPFRPVMSPGGRYVLGGLNGCPQARGPLFTGASGDRWQGRGAVGGRGGDGQEGVGQHREGDVAVPGAVAADLVVIEPGLVLGLCEAVLDRPPGPGHRGQFRQRGARRCRAQEERQFQLAFRVRRQGPADQQV